MSAQHSTRGPGDLAWFKSSYSGTSGDNCVEVAACADAIHVRDSKDRAAGATFRVTPEAWAAFIEQVARDL
jgi:hypothetical protein